MQSHAKKKVFLCVPCVFIRYAVVVLRIQDSIKLEKWSVHMTEKRNILVVDDEPDIR
jgi:hypothetical protein